jgi:hypothetical protein
MLQLYKAPYADRGVLLDILETEKARLLGLINDPRHWLANTYVEGWTVQDVVCHLVDETELYLRRSEMAGEGHPPQGMDLVSYQAKLRAAARAHHSLPRDEAIARFTLAESRMRDVFRALTEEQWGGVHIHHSLFGPLPVSSYPQLQIADYMLHGWDIEWGLGDKAATLDEKSAGALIGHVLNLWDYSFNRAAAEGVSMAYGIGTGGQHGGQWAVTVEDGEFRIEETESLGGLRAIFYYRNAVDMVLTRFHRVAASDASGDPDEIRAARRLFSGL